MQRWWEQLTGQTIYEHEPMSIAGSMSFILTTMR
jgi:hypothetical protein